MHPIDRLLMRLVLLPKWFFKKQGVEVKPLETILDAKLTMDDRIPASLFPQKDPKKQARQAKKNTKARFVTNLLFGLLLTTTMLVGSDDLTRLSIYFSSFMLIMCMTLITDFSTVLMDTKDNAILLSRPISEKTLLMVRMLHITVRVFRILLPMMIPGIIGVILLAGFKILLPFIFQMILLTFFCVFLVNALYFVLLKYASLQKLKTVLMAFQIVSAVLMMAVSQIVPRLMNVGFLKTTHLADIWWIQFLPPFWFADATLFLSFQPMHSASWLSAVISFLVPVVLIWLVVCYFAPSFMKGLAHLSVGVSESQIRIRQNKRWTSILLNTLSFLLNKKGLDRSAFEFIWRMMSRTREYKMKVLPQFGSMLVMFFILFTSSKDSTNLVIMVMYFSGFIITTALSELSFSDKFKGVWLYFVAPIQNPGPILFASFKAVIVMFYFPLMLFFAGLWFALIGFNNLPSLMLGLINQVTIASLYALMMMRTLPFSRAAQIVNGKAAFIRAMLVLLPQIGIGVLHFVFAKDLVVILITTAVSIALMSFFLNRLKTKSWSQLRL